MGLNEVNLMRDAIVKAEKIEDLYTLKWGFPWLKRIPSFPWVQPTTVWVPLQNAFDTCYFLAYLGYAITIVSVYLLASGSFIT